MLTGVGQLYVFRTPLNTYSIIASLIWTFPFAAIMNTYSQRLFREARTQRYYNECGPGSTRFPRNISPRCRGRQRWVHNDQSMNYIPNSTSDPICMRWFTHYVTHTTQCVVSRLLFQPIIKCIRSKVRNVCWQRKVRNAY